MPNTAKGFPYPAASDPVAQGAAAMQAIAESLEVRVPSSVAALPVAPYDGQIANLRLGATPFDYLQLTYDATLAKWVSAVDRVPLVRDHNSVITQTDISVFTELGATYNDWRLPWGARVTAGLTAQIRFSLMFGCTINNVAYYVKPTVYSIAVGGSWAFPTAIDACQLTIASGAAGGMVLRDSGWQNLVVGTVADYFKFRAQGMRATGGTGKAGQHSEMVVEVRWIK